MFTFRIGETLNASKHKIGLRSAAQREWSSLSPQDLARVETEGQLAELVSRSTGRTAADAAVEVRRWMQRQNMRPDIGMGSLARRPVSRWENEGGAIGRFVDRSTS